MIKSIGRVSVFLGLHKLNAPLAVCMEIDFHDRTAAQGVRLKERGTNI